MDEDRLLEMLKSTTLTVIVTECEREPLLAVTVTVYVPSVVELTVSVDVAVPLSTTLAGLRDAVSPEGVVSVRETVPVNPLRLLMVTVDV